MPKDEFSPFSASLNPFRTIERQIDTMFDDSFGAGAAGAMATTHPPAGSDTTDTVIEVPRQSLFMRVVQIDSTPRRRRWGG